MPSRQSRTEFQISGVCFTSPYSLSAIGGVGQFVRTLAQALRRAQVPTFAVYPNQKTSARTDAERPVVLTSPISKDIELALRTLRRIFKDRRRFAVVHAQQSHLQSVASLFAARMLGKAGLLTIHLKSAPPTSAVKRWIHSVTERLSLSLADAVVFVSPFVAAAFGWPGAVVIENGVDIDAYAPSAASRRATRDALGLANEFVFVFSGRWSHHKGIDLLLRATQSPPLRDRDYRVLLLGDLAPDEPNILDQALQRPEIRSRFIFAPRVQDVAAHLAAGDVFLLPSRTEGMSLSLLEAMAVGLPVLLSDLPVHTMLVRRYECGWLFRTEDPDDLGRMMTSLVANGVPSDLGQRSRKAAVENHSIHQMARGYMQLYADIVLRR